MSSPSKRICITKEPASASFFDIDLRTMYPHNGKEMMACLHITPNIVKQAKEAGVGLIVLADISVSMLSANKLSNLTKGITRISELSRFLKPHFSLITFNIEPNVVYDGEIPSTEQLQKFCDIIRPSGPCNLGLALQRAVEMATDPTRGNRTAHILLFTDGDDMSDLRARITDGDVDYIKTLRTAPSLFVHCVAICNCSDFKLLDAIASAARRGTFQYVPDDKIKNVMEELFYFMSLIIDPETYVTFTVDGVTTIPKKDVMILLPSPTVVPLGVVPAGAQHLTATFTVGNSSRATGLELAPRPADPAEPELADDACALLHIRQLVTENGLAVAGLIGARQFDDAVAATEATLAKIKAFIIEAGVSTNALHHAAYSFAEIHYCFARIADAQRSDEKLQEAEGRFLTEACITRNNNVCFLSRALTNMDAQTL